MSRSQHARKKSVLLLVLLSVLVIPVAAQQKSGDVKIKPYVFEHGQNQKTDAELGILLVPENRSDPDSNLIELAFVRFKSTAKNPGPPIVYLAGGPGGSGIGAARGSRFPLFMAMREVADVIAFDQRGTGMSKPNPTCLQRIDLPLDALPSNIQTHLADLAAVIKADPELGKKIPDFLGLMKSVFDRLEKEPAVVEITDARTKHPVKITVNKFVMQFLAADNIGTEVTRSYPALFYRASKGDYTNPAQAWLNQSRAGIGSAMSYMMDCASGMTPGRRTR
ncbi:MAG: hypothetical protein ACREBC_25295, partial [Pyrinomonadaceae bacterium]